MLFHTGHSGIGTGMPGGGGIRLKYGNPMHIDDVAVDFPDMPIILAHPSFPWQDEAISVCLHKPQVYIDLSGWSPKYFSPTLVQYANTLLKHKVLFGSDYPWITPDRWLGGLREDRHPPRRAAARAKHATRRRRASERAVGLGDAEPSQGRYSEELNEGRQEAHVPLRWMVRAHGQGRIHPSQLDARLSAGRLRRPAGDRHLQHLVGADAVQRALSRSSPITSSAASGRPAGSRSSSR